MTNAIFSSYNVQQQTCIIDTFIKIGVEPQLTQQQRHELLIMVYSELKNNQINLRFCNKKRGISTFFFFFFHSESIWYRFIGSPTLRLCADLTLWSSYEHLNDEPCLEISQNHRIIYWMTRFHLILENLAHFWKSLPFSWINFVFFLFVSWRNENWLHRNNIHRIRLFGFEIDVSATHREM